MLFPTKRFFQVFYSFIFGFLMIFTGLLMTNNLFSSIIFWSKVRVFSSFPLPFINPIRYSQILLLFIHRQNNLIESFFQHPMQTYGYALLFSIFGYLGIDIVLTLIKEYGALICVTVTTCRKAVTIILSFILFSKPFIFEQDVQHNVFHYKNSHFLLLVMFGLVLLLLLVFISMSIVATKQHSMQNLHLMLLVCSVLVGFRDFIQEHPREPYLCDIFRESHTASFYYHSYLLYFAQFK